MKKTMTIALLGTVGIVFAVTAAHAVATSVSTTPEPAFISHFDNRDSSPSAPTRPTVAADRHGTDTLTTIDDHHNDTPTTIDDHHNDTPTTIDDHHNDTPTTIDDHGHRHGGDRGAAGSDSD